MLNQIEIGEKIAVARKLKNISQAELAEKLYISAQAVGKWERGESMPDILMFQSLASVLGVDLNYFVGTETSSLDIYNSINTESENDDSRNGWNMSAGNWVDADFSGLSGLAEKFSGSNIQNCKFIESDLSGLNLQGNNMQKCDLTNSNLNGSIIKGSNFNNDIFKQSSFQKAQFIGTFISECNLDGADFTGTEILRTYLSDCSTNGTIWKNTTFRGSSLGNITLGGDFTDCSFEGLKASGLKKFRLTFSNAFFRNCFFKNCNLKKVIFENCQADKLSLAFLKNNNADLSNIKIIEE